MGVPPQLDVLQWEIPSFEMDDDQGYPYFRNPPYQHFSCDAAMPVTSGKDLADTNPQTVDRSCMGCPLWMNIQSSPNRWKSKSPLNQQGFTFPSIWGLLYIYIHILLYYHISMLLHIFSMEKDPASSDSWSPRFSRRQAWSIGVAVPWSPWQLGATRGKLMASLWQFV